MIGVKTSFRQTSAWGHCRRSFSFDRPVIADLGWGHRVIGDKLIGDLELRWDLADV